MIAHSTYMKHNAYFISLITSNIHNFIATPWIIVALQNFALFCDDIALITFEYIDNFMARSLSRPNDLCTYWEYEK